MFFKLPAQSEKIFRCVTKEKENFRQMFALNRQAEDFIFSAADEFNFVETMIYAAEDTEIEIISPTKISAEKFAKKKSPTMRSEKF